MAGVDSWQSCYAALPFRVCVKGQEGNAGWIFSIFSPWSMMKRQQDCDIQRCCCYRHSALAGVEGELGGGGFLACQQKTAGSVCMGFCAEKSCSAVCNFSFRPLGTERLLLRGMCWGRSNSIKKKKSSPSV